MTLILDWIKDLTFVAADENGHGIILDSKKEGLPIGFTPMQLLLIAAAGCMAMDVVSILKKKRLPLVGFRVEMEGDRAAEHPKRFTEMRFVYIAQGQIPQKDLEEAIRLSEEKYCSVSATIKNAPRIIIQGRVEEI